jgi:rhodanese-related sulfurtransferase
MFSSKSKCLVVCISLLLLVVLLAAACAPRTDGEPLVLYTTIPASRDEIPRITPEELKAMMDRGETVIIVDCNSEEMYQSQHIPGAVNILWDLGGLEEDPDLSKSTLIVAYCVCPNEESSGDVALQMITDFGYRNIKLLLGGDAKWRDLGYSMEKVE